MENASVVSWELVSANLLKLKQQLTEYANSSVKSYELIFALSGNEEDATTLLHEIQSRVPGLSDVSKLSVVPVENGRYYELKNAGLLHSTGDVVIFLDSDCTIESQWLENLLQPFQRSGIHAVNGYTYLAYEDFTSRILALTWLFPLRDHDDRIAKRRALNMNNCAFTGDWIRSNPFEIDNGFKVSCSKLSAKLAADHIAIERAPAYASHAPLRGWRFIAWRAWVTGRDADRKYVALRSSNILARLINALKFNWKLGSRSLHRVATRYRMVGMPLIHMPIALLVAFAFSSITLIGQCLHVLGFRKEHPESIPTYAEFT
jgi:glycosyltransferase involved in cell wall biosynthesis